MTRKSIVHFMFKFRFKTIPSFVFFTELYRTSMGTTPLIYIARLRLLFRISDINAANDFFYLKLISCD